MPSAFTPFSDLGVAVFGISQNGALVFANRPGLDLVGCEEGDLLCRSIAEIAHEMTEMNWTHFWSGLSENGWQTGQWRIVRGNKETVEVDFSAIYLTNAENAYCCAIPREENSEAPSNMLLEADHFQLSPLLNCFDGPAIVLDDQLKISLLNELACLRFHTVNSSARGKSLNDFFSGGQAQLLFSMALRARESNRPVQIASNDFDPQPAGLQCDMLFPITDKGTRKRSVIAILSKSQETSQAIEPIPSVLRASLPELTSNPISIAHRAVEDSPVHFFVKDTNNAFIWTSRSYWKLFGLANDGFLGISVEKIPSFCRFAPEWRRQDEDLIRSGKPVLNLIERHANDSRCSLRTDKFPLFDHREQLCGIFGYTIEIGENDGNGSGDGHLDHPDANITRTLSDIRKAIQSISIEASGIGPADKSEYFEKVKNALLPYVLTLKDSIRRPDQMKLVELIESNIRKLADPFIEKVNSPLFCLSPTELQVAQFIKDGKSNKEISDFMHLSKSTILTHRHHRREKLGLKNKKKNLRTSLLSL